MNYICVVVGGGLGALLRYLSGRFINSVVVFHQFKFGTVFVNCVGALLIGFFAAFAKTVALNPKWNLLVVVGFLGGYTTFSAYSLETVQYLMDGKLRYAAANILLNNVLSLAFVGLGFWLHKPFEVH